ncbi:MAG: hypothetical protein PHI23_00960 [Candidatus Peribacteraceae bacterium]|nr:hypothetical protein [Candidatus Peribacteraceae bacterium]
MNNTPAHAEAPVFSGPEASPAVADSVHRAIERELSRYSQRFGAIRVATQGNTIHVSGWVSTYYGKQVALTEAGKHANGTYTVNVTALDVR